MAADPTAEHEVVSRNRVHLLLPTAAWITGVGLMEMARSRVNQERNDHRRRQRHAHMHH
ncbi:hypothetical protein GCM10009798_06790 [Nocardioides panacihumi]|uniref:Uncharacterized protein n=1 Tax=Nocardioides panacihumi TaxID=400774 RepID=A0ABN2QEJ3_9ACTN